MKAALIFYLSVFCVFFNLSADAETLKVGVGLSKPPYIIQESNSGAEYEIVKRSLELAGYQMEPRYMPLLRISHSINGGSIDAGMTMRPHMKVNGYFSDVVVLYHNYAISLSEDKLEVSSLEDLGDRSVLAFQNAKKLLGDEFFNAVKNNGKYSEVANQELQVKMLAGKRIELIIADFRIFLHFKKQFEKQYNREFEIRFHRLFEPTPYHVGFKDEAVRDKFNEGLAKLRQSGEYDAILYKYIQADKLDGLSIQE